MGFVAGDGVAIEEPLAAIKNVLIGKAFISKTNGLLCCPSAGTALRQGKSWGCHLKFSRLDGLLREPTIHQKRQLSDCA